MDKPKVNNIGQYYTIIDYNVMKVLRLSAENGYTCRYSIALSKGSLCDFILGYK